MTTGTEIDLNPEEPHEDQQATAKTPIPQEIIEIFEYLSGNINIVFKSQQINDPDLQRWEKIEIATDLYNKNRQTFLQRFGSYMDEQHLRNFERIVLLEKLVPLNEDEYEDEIQLLIANFQQKLMTRKRDVRNRRYTAMQQLIKKGEYFSEQEMMKRSPELYQELVGQYLSAEEKKQRDSYDVKNTSFSGILMHTMQAREMQSVLKDVDKKLQAKEPDLSEDSSNEQSLDNHLDGAEYDKLSEETIIDTDDNTYDEIPVSYRQQWGGFDNVKVACSVSRSTHASHNNISSKTSSQGTPSGGKHKVFITAGERELLRQEFIGLMHEKFLEGKDNDFDYSKVDDNTDLDDLQQINQDKEDAYFEDSDNDEDENYFDRHVRSNRLESESEDELDIYMFHLNRHHSLQN